MEPFERAFRNFYSFKDIFFIDSIFVYILTLILHLVKMVHHSPQLSYNFNFIVAFVLVKKVMTIKNISYDILDTSISISLIYV